MVGDLRNRAVVVEEQGEPPAAQELADPVLEVAVRDRLQLVVRFGGRAQELVEPAIEIVTPFAALQRLHARGPILAGHREGAMQVVGDAVDVVRVDPQRLVHRLGGARHAGEQEHPRLVDAARDELLRDEVHAIAQRRHQRDVGVAVEAREFGGRHRAVQIADRRPRTRREFAVDAPDEFVDLTLQRLVLADLGAARDRDLQQHDLLPMLGVELEQALEAEDALGYALRVVEPVDTQDHALATATQCARRAEREPLLRGVVDTEGKRAHMHGAIAVLDLPRQAVDAFAEKPLDAVEKVRDVAGAVEADEIAAEHAEQQLAVPRQDPVDVVRRKRDMQKERDTRIRPDRAQGGRGAEQLVVVDPDQIVVADRVGRRPGEALVDGLVGLPVAAVELGPFGQGVEQRPQRAVREAVVVATHLGRAELDRGERETLVDIVDRLVRAQRAARPTDPGAAAALHRGFHRRDESARRLLDLELAARPAHRDRQAVGHDHERCVCRSGPHFASISFSVAAAREVGRASAVLEPR